MSQVTGFRFYFDKDLDYLISEEEKYCIKYYAIRRAKNRLRRYATLFTRDCRKIMIKADSVCRFCNTSEQLELDHIIPITKNGKNTICNLQILCRICNRKKSNKL